MYVRQKSVCSCLYCLLPATSEKDRIVARKHSESIQDYGRRCAKRRRYSYFPMICAVFSLVDGSREYLREDVAHETVPLTCELIAWSRGGLKVELTPNSPLYSAISLLEDPSISLCSDSSSHIPMPTSSPTLLLTRSPTRLQRTPRYCSPSLCLQLPPTSPRTSHLQ
jgi:hypothetical protein